MTSPDVRPEPHPSTVFSLVPINPRAKAVLDHPSNGHLISVVHNPDDPLNNLGINVGPHISSSSQYALTTLGRGGTDITLEGATISRTHCSFDINQEFGTILLHDRSTAQATNFFGEDRQSFEKGRIRRVVVAPAVNTLLGIGGHDGRQLLFKLLWHKEVINWKDMLKIQSQNSCDTRTVSSSRCPTSLNTPAAPSSTARYASLHKIGTETFGDVWQAVETDTGMLITVKVVKDYVHGTNDVRRMMVKRELDTLAKLSHPHVVECKGFWQDLGSLTILMALRDGNVEDLIHQGVSEPTSDRHLAVTVLRHVLIGIHYLSSKNIAHRNLKPANIIFTKNTEAGCQFQITDFSVANSASNTTTVVMSPRYAAPEVLCSDGRLQTSKADIWSLFVTMAHVLNVDGYRDKTFGTHAEIIQSACNAAEDRDMSDIKDMVIVEPEERASAAQMLQRLLGGELGYAA
ncbi:putative peroxisomal-coenzyme A synthetase [Fonsecaea nubica]|uniref:Putative peroxisomal-coenzyme A synthetase n=1 Tax=Fonsecaea nubica TaxID=856822 RepID=A0A178C0U2_9EURO|nr:putative peroxisomal-coenzyme A synthetase [Fonsecaea nubica]OAL22371.1 putative peroxisomal-coenzyme A synthetase [Fonsecaea nubica]